MKITGLVTWQYKIYDGKNVIWVDYDNTPPIRLIGTLGKAFVTFKIPNEISKDGALIKRKVAERVRAVGVENTKYIVFPIGLPDEIGFYDHRIRITDLEEIEGK